MKKALYAIAIAATFTAPAFAQMDMPGGLAPLLFFFIVLTLSFQGVVELLYATSLRKYTYAD